MEEAAAHPVLVISDRWQTRALLAAELGERVERDVVPAADVPGALRMIKLGGLDPTLMVVDAGPGIRAEDVERLLEAKRDVPLVLVVSRLRRDTFDALVERCAAYLLRPVRIGTVVEMATRLLHDLSADDRVRA